MNMLEALRQARANDEPGPVAGSRLAAHSGFSLHTLFAVVATAAIYFLTTQIAWAVTFPDSRVSLFFPPHAVLVSILLLVPTRHWWAYSLAAAGVHFIATQQAGWPPLYALQCEAFDAAKYLLTAAGIRHFIRSPFDRITMREAILFVLIAVVVVPFGTALWGAAFTVANQFGGQYWVEWRNLGVSNGVTAIVLVPAILLGANVLRDPSTRVEPLRVLEACLLASAILAVGYFAFNREPAGPDTSPALLYSPIPLLIWAALRFGLGGVSMSMLAITMMAIWGTMLGRGPFLTQTPEENALALQLFLLMAATPLLLLAVAITDERNSQEALRISEERMSTAAECAQIVLWEWDVAHDIVWISDEGRAYFGFDSSEPIDHSTLAGRIHPDDVDARAAAIDATLTTGSIYESEFRLVLPDGSVRWVAARGRRMDHDAGAPQRVLGISMDITRQKQARAEAQLQREELAHLSRVATLSLLSSSLAHELSQPLASILGNAQAGQRHMAAASPDLAEVRDILDDIVGEDRRAGEIISRLRTMLRRGEVTLQPVSVNECIDELLRLTRSDLITRGVAIANLATADLPAVMTDRVQLQQVLLNLIVNACDAMAANDADDRKVTIRTTVDKDTVCISVLDCGVGLPDDIESLFQPLFTTKSQGLGMGLSICRTLVAAHGGKLWAERRAERGAAFHVVLPLAAENVP